MNLQLKQFEHKRNFLLMINRNTNVILEAKNNLIFSKTSILQQKFEFFCKLWVVDAGYL